MFASSNSQRSFRHGVGFSGGCDLEAVDVEHLRGKMKTGPIEFVPGFIESPDDLAQLLRRHAESELSVVDDEVPFAALHARP